mgnify:CR=1 FL=1
MGSLVDKEDAEREYDIKSINLPVIGKYDASIFAVSHNEFKQMIIADICKLGRQNHGLYDMKFLLKADEADEAGGRL